MRGSSPRMTNAASPQLLRCVGRLRLFGSALARRLAFSLAVALGDRSFGGCVFLRRCLARCAPLGAAAAFRLGVDERNRLVERDALRRRARRQGGIDAGMADVGTVASGPGNDLATFLGMLAERAPRRGL